MTKRRCIFAEKLGDTPMKTQKISRQSCASATSFNAVSFNDFFSPESAASVQALINELGLVFVKAEKM